MEGQRGLKGGVLGRRNSQQSLGGKEEPAVTGGLGTCERRGHLQGLPGAGEGQGELCGADVPQGPPLPCLSSLSACRTPACVYNWGASPMRRGGVGEGRGKGPDKHTALCPPSQGSSPAAA